jgi:hypothetical protein
MNTSLKSSTDLSKKVYTRLKNTKPLDQQCSVKLENRLILKAGPTSSLQEQFKKLFLPLLSDVLELRQCIDTLNLKAKNDLFKITGNKVKSNEELICELECLKDQIEESINWHSSIYKQIIEAIGEAKNNQENESLEHGCWVEKLTKLLRAK